MNKKFPQKIFLFFLLFSVGLFQAPSSAGQKFLRIHFINVGYGDAILLELPDQTTWLIDAGEEDSSAHLIEYLNASDVQRIDTAMITHPHQNHFQGFFAVLKEMPIGRVFINGDANAAEGYAELLDEFYKRQIPVKIIKEGQVFDELPEGVTIEILHPDELKGNPNGNSVVTWVEHGNIKILLTADIGPEEQEALLMNYPRIKQADLIQIPHHGGTLAAQFIRNFADKIFVISTGANEWGLPHEEDLRALKGMIYRTDQSGPIVFSSNGAALEMLHE